MNESKSTFQTGKKQKQSQAEQLHQSQHSVQKKRKNKPNKKQREKKRLNQSASQAESQEGSFHSSQKTDKGAALLKDQASTDSNVNSDSLVTPKKTSTVSPDEGQATKVRHPSLIAPFEEPGQNQQAQPVFSSIQPDSQRKTEKRSSLFSKYGNRPGFINLVGTGIMPLNDSEVDQSSLRIRGSDVFSNDRIQQANDGPQRSLELQDGHTFVNPEATRPKPKLGPMIKQPQLYRPNEQYYHQLMIQHTKDIGEKILQQQNDIAIHSLNKGFQQQLEQGRMQQAVDIAEMQINDIATENIDVKLQRDELARKLHERDAEYAILADTQKRMQEQLNAMMNAIAQAQTIPKLEASYHAVSGDVSNNELSVTELDFSTVNTLFAPEETILARQQKLQNVGDETRADEDEVDPNDIYAEEDDVAEDHDD